MENNSQQRSYEARRTGFQNSEQNKIPRQENGSSVQNGRLFPEDAHGGQTAAAATSKIKSFKELIVWQKSFELVREIYAATATFPREELYGLVSQLRRSAVSVPSNIAEGFRRRFQKELKQFLNIALGSLAEIETQIAIAGELGYLNPEKLGRLAALTDQVIRLAIGLSKKI